MWEDEVLEDVELDEEDSEEDDLSLLSSESELELEFTLNCLFGFLKGVAATKAYHRVSTLTFS